MLTWNKPNEPNQVHLQVQEWGAGAGAGADAGAKDASGVVN